MYNHRSAGCTDDNRAILELSMRTFRVIRKEPTLRNEYISEEEYSIVAFGDTVVYKSPEGQSFMALSMFKQALRDGSIVFTG